MIILGAGLSFQTFSFLGQLVFFPNFAFLPLSYPIDMVMVKGQEFQCRMGGGRSFRISNQGDIRMEPNYATKKLYNWQVKVIKLRKERQADICRSP